VANTQPEKPADGNRSDPNAASCPPAGIVRVAVEVTPPESLYNVNVTVAGVALEFAIANPVVVKSEGMRRLGKANVDCPRAAIGKVIHNTGRISNPNHLPLPNLIGIASLVDGHRDWGE
jgi:hypothetical protein